MARRTEASTSALADLVKAAKRAKSEKLERALYFHLKASGLPKPELQFRFHPTRAWRFDFAWPAALLAVEMDGGVWSQGRHSRGAGQIADMEKQAEAVLLGWRLLRVTGHHLQTGQAIEWVRRGLAGFPEVGGLLPSVTSGACRTPPHAPACIRGARVSTTRGGARRTDPSDTGA